MSALAAILTSIVHPGGGNSIPEDIPKILSGDLRNFWYRIVDLQKVKISDSIAVEGENFRFNCRCFEISISRPTGFSPEVRNEV